MAGNDEPIIVGVGVSSIDDNNDIITPKYPCCRTKRAAAKKHAVEWGPQEKEKMEAKRARRAEVAPACKLSKSSSGLEEEDQGSPLLSSGLFEEFRNELLEEAKVAVGTRKKILAHLCSLKGQPSS